MDKLKKIPFLRYYDVENNVSPIVSFDLHPTKHYLLVAHQDGQFAVHNFHSSSRKPLAQGNLADSLSGKKIGNVLSIKYFPVHVPDMIFDAVCLSENHIIFLDTSQAATLVLDPVQLNLGKQFGALEILHFETKLFLAVHVDGLVKLFDLRGSKVVKRLEKVSCKSVLKLMFFFHGTVPLLAIATSEFHVALYNCKTETIVHSATYKEFRDMYFDAEREALVVLTVNELIHILLIGFSKKATPIHPFGQTVLPFAHPALTDSSTIILGLESSLTLFDRNSTESQTAVTPDKVLFQLTSLGFDENAKLENVVIARNRQFIFLHHTRGITAIVIDPSNYAGRESIGLLNDTGLVCYANDAHIVSQLVTKHSKESRFPLNNKNQNAVLLKISPSRQFLILFFKRSFTYNLVKINTWEIIAHGVALDVAWCDYKDCFVLITSSTTDDDKCLTSRSASTSSISAANKTIDKDKQDKAEKSSGGSSKSKSGGTVMSAIKSGKKKDDKKGVPVLSNMPASTSPSPLLTSKEQIWFSIREIDSHLFRAKTIEHKLFDNIVPLQVFGGSFIGFKFTTKTSKKSFVTFYTWSKPSFQVLAPVIAPNNIFWDQHMLYCLMVYENYFTIFSAQNSFQNWTQVCKVENVNVVDALWHRGTLFYSTFTSVYCFFPLKTQGFLPPGFPLRIQNHGPMESTLSFIGFSKGSLSLSYVQTKRFVQHQIESPLLKCFMLVQAGCVADGLKWMPLIPRERYSEVLSFLVNRGHHEAAFAIPQIPLATMMLIAVEKPIQHAALPDILRRRFLEIKEKGATAYEIDTTLSLALELLRKLTFRGNEKLFQEIYLALGEFDPQFGRNLVTLSKLLEYDVESGLGVARVVDRLKNNSTNSFVFYQSLSTHQDKFQFHVKDWEANFLRDNCDPSLPRAQFVQAALIAHRQLPATQVPYLDDCQYNGLSEDIGALMHCISVEEKERRRLVKEQLQKEKLEEKKKNATNSAATTYDGEKKGMLSQSTGQLSHSAVDINDPNKRSNDARSTNDSISHDETTESELGEGGQQSHLSTFWRDRKAPSRKSSASPAYDGPRGPLTSVTSSNTIIPTVVLPNGAPNTNAQPATATVLLRPSRSRMDSSARQRTGDWESGTSEHLAPQYGRSPRIVLSLRDTLDKLPITANQLAEEGSQKSSDADVDAEVGTTDTNSGKASGEPRGTIENES